MKTRKSILKKLLAVILCAAMLLPNVGLLGALPGLLGDIFSEIRSDIAPEADAEEAVASSFTHYYYIPSGTNVVYEFATAYSNLIGGSLNKAKGYLTDDGYVTFAQDFNENAGGAYIAIGYKTTTAYNFGSDGNEGNGYAITGIALYNSTSNSKPDTFTKTINGVTCTFYIVDTGPDSKMDLNKGKSGEYLWMYYTTDNCGAPITDFSVDANTSASGYNTVQYYNSEEAADFNRGAGGDDIFMHYRSTGTVNVTAELASLRNYYNTVSAAVQTEYTPISWATFSTAKIAAKSILDAYNTSPYSSAYSSAAITAALSTLTNAYDGLAHVPEDTTLAYIVVPETIYLTPSLGTTSSFQYYVDNSYNRTTKTVSPEANAADTTGNWYFDCENATNLTVQIISGAGSANGAINGGGSVSLTSKQTASLSSGYAYGTLASGALSAALSQGGVSQIGWKFIWTLASGVKQTQTVYTTCYAPYSQPVGAAVKAHDTNDYEVWVQQASWWQGVQGMTDRPSNIYTGWSGHDDTAAYYPLATHLSPMTSNVYIGNGQTGITSWLSTSANGGMNQASIYYGHYYADGNDNWVTSCSTGFTAVLAVDTSRYSNLNLIPNLKIGTYLSDYENVDSRKEYRFWTYRGTCYHTAGKTDARYHEVYDPTDGLFASNIEPPTNFLYNAPYNYVLALNSTGTENFAFKALINGEHASGGQDDWACAVTYCPISVTKVNKTNMRTLVNACISANYQSRDYTAASFNAYKTAFQNAQRYLGDPTVSEASVENYRNALQTAVNNLVPVYPLIVDGNNGAYNMLYLTDYAASIASTTSATFTYALAHDAENELTITGSAAGNGAAEQTTMIPVYAYLQEGHTYTFRWKATVNNLELYLFLNGGAACRGSFSGGTANGDGTYTFERTFTLGSAAGMGDCTWANYPAECDGVYQIRMDINSGSAISSFTVSDLRMTETDGKGVVNKVQSGATIGVNFPHRIAYTFQGWLKQGGTLTTNTALKKYTYTSAAPEGQLVAQWVPTTYHITYNYNYAGMPNTSVDYDVEESFHLQTPSRPGYTFTGWTKTATDEISTWTASTYAGNTAVSGAYGNVTLRANWTANTYYVSVDNLFNFKKWKDAGITSGNGTLAAITETGFTFTSTHAGNDGYTVPSPMMSVEENTQYTLQFDVVGSGYEAYVFYYNANGEAVYRSDAPTLAYNDTANNTMTFTTPDTTAYIRLRIDANANGNSVQVSNFRIFPAANAYCSTSVAAASRNRAVTYDTAYGALPAATRPGYTFTGWNTKPDGSGTAVTAATVYQIPADSSVWSQWSVNTYELGYDNLFFARSFVNNSSPAGADDSMSYDASTDTISFTTGASHATVSTPLDNTSLHIPVAANTEYIFSYEVTNNLASTNSLVAIFFWNAAGSLIGLNECTASYGTQSGSPCPYLIRYGALRQPTPAAWGYNGTSIISGTWAEDVGVAPGSGNFGYADIVFKTPANISYITVAFSNGAANMTSQFRNIQLRKTFSPVTSDINAEYKDPTYAAVNRFYTAENGTFTSLITPSRVGYTFGGWFTGANGTGTQVTGSTAVSGFFNDTTLFSKWTANTDTAYTVEHYQMNLDGATYTRYEVENKTGTTATAVTPAVKTYTGFTSPATQTQVIKADGTLVVQYYYTRNRYTLQTTAGTGVSDATGGASYYYGQTVTVGATVRQGYTWQQWVSSNTALLPSSTTQGYSFTMPAGAVTLTANATANTNTPYVVNHYQRALDGTTTVLIETDSLTGTTDTSVTPLRKSYTGFTAPNGQEVAINGAGTTVVNYIYERTVYNFTTSVDGVTTTTPYKYGAAVATPAEPSKEGYSFAGWSPVVPATMPANAMTVTAQFTINSYTVTYIVDGTTVHTDTVNYATAIPAYSYSRTGYTFSGWNTTVPAVMPAASLTFTGSTAPINYSIGYTLNGGTVSPENPTVYTIESAAITLNNPTKAGYTFSGWSGDGTGTDVTIPAGSYGNKNYTANWTANPQTYVIRTYYMTTAGVYDTYTETSASSVTGATVSTAPAAVTGFTLDNAGSTLSGTVPATGTLVLTVKYSRDRYAVTVNGGTGIAGVTGAAASVYYGASVTVGATLVNGYSWAKWTSANGSLLPDSTSQSYHFTMPAGNVTLTASAVTVEYTISYSLGGGSVSPANKETYKVTDAAFTLTNPTRPYYTFAGWTGTGISGSSASVIVPTGSTGNRTYNATWTPDTYSVTYHLDGGSVAVANRSSYTVETPSFTLNNPTKTGFTFTGWSGTELDGTVSNVTVPVGSHGARSYTATWTPNTDTAYTVYHQKQKLDGGWELADTDNLTGTTGDTLTPATKSYTGFAAPVQQSLTIAADGSASITYQYTRRSYRITYSVEGLTSFADYLYEESITPPAEPVKTGYAFTGWSPVIPATMPANTLTVTAQFEAADVSFTVRHYGQNASDNEYAWMADTTLTAKADSSVTLAELAGTYTGFGYSHGQVGGTTVATATVAADGSTVVSLYYVRDAHTLTVTYSMSDGTAAPAVNSQSLRYGKAYTVTSPTVAGYTPSRASVTGTMGTEDIAESVTYSPNAYTLTIHYVYNGGEQAAPDYVDTAVLCNTAYSVNSPEITGYTADQTVVSGTMGAGNAEVTVTYNVNSYTLNILYLYADNSEAAPAFTQTYSYGDSYSVSSPAVTGYTPSPALVSGTMGASAVHVTVVYTINTFSVTFLDYDNSQLGAVQTVNYGSAATAPAVPSRTGHSFTGWDTDFSNVTGNLTVKALYDVNRYTIAFNSNGGSPVASITEDFGTSVAAPANPTKTGYDFAGWFTDDGTFADAYVFASMPAENRTLYAKWTLVEYTLAYVLGGGTAENPGSYTFETPTFTLQNPLRQGFSFTGWTGGGISTPTTTVTISAGSTGSRTYTANWAAADVSYTVEHYKQNTDGSYPAVATNSESVEAVTGSTVTPSFKPYAGFTAPAAQTVTVAADGSTLVRYEYTRNSYTITYETIPGETYTTVTALYEAAVNAPATEPTRTGYRFESWNAATPATMPLDGMTITALWTAEEYTITYSGMENAAFGENHPATHTFGAATEVSDPVKTGYTFAGWAVNGGAAVRSLTLGAEDYTADITLLATWTADAADYTVAVYYMNTDGAYPAQPSSAFTIHSFTDTPVAYTMAVETGFTADTAQSTLTGIVAHDGSTVLSAYYSRNLYTLSLTAGTGIASVSGADRYYYGETVTAGASAQAGYTWAAWTGDIPSASAANSFSMPAADVALTATATLDTYTITINPAGGVFAEGETIPDTYTVLSEAIVIYNPTKTGYTFAGWSGDGVGTNVVLAAGSTGNKAYTATWTRDTYSIDYTMNGGINAAANPTSYHVASAEFSLVAPSKTGYTFLGWSFAGQETPTTEVTVPTGSTGNLAFTANWSANEVGYTVRHYKQDVNGQNFALESTDASQAATADSVLTLADLAVASTGFTYAYAKVGGSTLTDATVAPDGSLVVDLYYTRNQYELTLTGDAGIDSLTGAGSYYYEAAVNADATLLTGYDWNGWTSSDTALLADSGDKPYAFTMPAGSVTLSAGTTEHSYTISYTLGGGTATNPVSYTISTPAFTLANPTRTGYDFAGWTGTGISTASQSVTVSQGSVGNRTYIATWTAHPYTLTYILDGGAQATGETNPDSYTITTATFTLKNPVKQGFVFAGWTEGGAASQTVTIESGSTGDRTFTATWTPASDTAYTVKYMLEDIDADTYTEAIADRINGTGTTLTSISPAVRAYEGFTAPERQTAVIAADGSTLIEYFYTRNSYIITYNTLPGSVYLQQSYEYGKAVAAPAAPERTGYSFNNWDAAVPATMPDRALTRTAEWSLVTYTITYELNDGTNDVANPNSYNYESPAITLAAPTKTGYTFRGWTYDGQATPEMSVTIAANSTGSRSFTANWAANTDTRYTVYYYTEPVEGSADHADFTLQNTILAEGVSDSTVTVTPADMEGFTTPDEVSLFVKPDGTAEVAFYYTRNQYTLTYRSEGSADAVQTYYYAAAVTAPALSPRTGYTFNGWVPAVPATMPAENRTVVADWTANTYAITYTGMEDAVYGADAPSAHVYGTATPVSDPSRVGYTFAGWTVNGMGSYKNLVLAADGYTAPITLAATWTAIQQQYIVEYYLMNLDGETYSADSSLRGTFNTTTGEEVTAIVGTVSGFTYNAALSTVSGTVPGTGTLELKLYFDRNSNTLTWDIDGVTTSDTLYYAQSIPYPATAPEKQGYTFTGWDPSGLTLMPDYALTLTAQFRANTDTAYTVNHYWQDIGGENYTLHETQNLGGETAATVSPAVKTYTGFTAPAVQTAVIAADGSTVINYYYTRNTYAVTVNAVMEGLSDGTGAGTCYYGQTVTVSATVAAGYTWTGWVSEDTGVLANSNDRSYTFTMPAAAVELTGYCSKDTYTLTYAGLEGTTGADTNPASYTVTDAAINLANPAKTGYTFLGWSGTAIEGFSFAVTIPAGSVGDRRYTANWQLNEYTITYTLAEGSVAEANPVVYYVTSGAITLHNPTRTGYTFTGWTGTDEAALNTSVTIPAGSVGNRSFEAHWQANEQSYTVEVYVMDIAGAYPAEATETYTYTALTDASVRYTMAARSGFTAMTEDSILTGVIPAAGTLTLRAYYSRNQYAVTVAAGTGIAASSGAGTYYYGAPVTVSAAAATGYTWNRWTGTYESVAANYSFTMPASAVSLAANASLNSYSISYTLAGGVVEGVNPDAYSVTSAAITLLNPTRRGYTFTGWSGTGLDGLQMTVIIPTGSIGARAYTANWQLNTYLISYDYAGGSATGNPNSYTVEDSFTLVNPTRTGYTFTGWTGTDEGMQVTVTGGIGARSYTATWSANTDTLYTVNHYRENVTGTGFELYATEEFRNGTSDATVTPAVKAYEGFSAPDAQIVPVAPDGSTVVNYYYERTIYSITYVIAGQANIEVSYYYDAPVATPAAPVRDGYSFVGWDGSIPAKMPAGALQFTALWNAETYTVTFNANGGEAMNEIQYTVETPVTLPTAARTGYTFTGWTVAAADATANNWEAAIAGNGAALAVGLFGNVTLTATWTPNTNTAYSVVHMFMDTEGAAYVEDSSVTVHGTGTSDTSVTPAVLTREGFDAPAPQTVTIAPDGSTVVEYRYDRRQYTLTWVAAGSEDTVETYYYGAAVTRLANPERNGYTFAAWDNVVPATMPSVNTVLTATWSILTYSIAYELAGGSVAGSNPDSYTVETPSFTLLNPTRAGYTFTGWTGTDNGSTIKVALGSTGDRSYTANWQADEQTYYVDVYYMTTEGVYNTVPEETIELHAATDTPVSYTMDAVTGFAPDAPNCSLAGSVPGTGTLRLTAKYARNQYTVTFDQNGGSPVAAITDYYEAPVTAPADPTRTGYTFTGWTPAVPATMPAENVTLTAGWNENSYTLTFAEAGGTSVEDITYGITSAAVLPSVSRPGFFFLGWRVTTAGGAWSTADAYYAAGTAVAGKYGSATLTAQWTTVEYTLSYDANGGAVTPATVTYTVLNPGALSLPLPTRPGYSFTGWKAESVTDDAGSPGYISWTVDTVYPAGTSLTDTYGNAVFAAQWSANTYAVAVTGDHFTYTGAATATAGVAYAATIGAATGYTLPASVSLTVGGNAVQSGAAYTYERNAEATQATLTIFGAAVIGDIAISFNGEVITYTLSYDLGDPRATVSGNPASYTVESAAITLANPTMTGFTFTGWTGTEVAEASTAVNVPAGSTGNRSFTAHWQADAQVYHVNVYYMTTEGTYNTTPDTVLSFHAQTDAEVSYEMPAVTGFTANSTISTLAGTVPGAGSLELLAKYDRNTYTLTLDGSDAGISLVTGTNTYYYDKEITINATVRAGYTWNGWTAADADVLPGSASKSYTFRMPAADAALAATTTLDVYTISYALAGGSVDGTNPTAYSVTDADFTLVNPTRAGYTFAGWTGTGLGSATALVTVAAGSTGNRSYVATWAPDSYTISYDLAEGTATGSNPISYNIESAAITLSNPVRTGYTFSGWSGTGLTGDENITVTIPIGSMGNRDYTAHWTADAHTYTVLTYFMSTEGSYAAASDTQVLAGNTDALVSVTPETIAGFTFDAANSVLSGIVLPDNSLVLTVRYTRNTYELQLTAGTGISSVSGAGTYYYDAPVSVSAVVAAGYTFEGWSAGEAAAPADSTLNPYSFRMPAADAALHATASEDTYHITYALAGGSIEGTNPLTYRVTDSAFTLENPTRRGYTFAGWTGTDSGLTVTVPAGSTGDRSYTATWTIDVYSITYALAGGSVASNPNAYTVETVDFTLQNPTRSGYDFAGWTGTELEAPEMTVTVPTGSVGARSYTATWTPRNDTAYEVRYYLMATDGSSYVESLADRVNGAGVSDTEIMPPVLSYTGFTAPAPETHSINADGSLIVSYYYTRNRYTYTFRAIGYDDIVQTNYYDAPVIAPSNLMRDGYTFAGWTPQVPANMPDAAQTATAVWSVIQYPISYALGGGTVSGNPTSYTVEQGFTLLNPVRSGYTFTGWSGTGIAGTSMLVTVTDGTMGERHYVANWEVVTYAISYDLDGGTAAGNPYTYTIEDSFTLVNPVKTGYTFIGWTGSAIYGYSSSVNISAMTGDRSYVAHWTPSNDTPYTVRHFRQDIGAGTYSLAEEEVLHGTTGTTVSPAVKNYAGFTSPSRRSVAILADGSAVLEYYYNRNTYTIYFDSNGGSDISSQSYEYGETITPPYAPQWLGYSFTGWTPALPETMPGYNLYVSAAWEANNDTPYTIYHYLQNTDCLTYSDENCDIEYAYGETGAIITAPVRSYEGFTAPAAQTIVIAADGSRIVRYYYTRNTYTVQFNAYDGTRISLQTVVYDCAATAPAAPARTPDATAHYLFAGWSMDFEHITDNAVITAVYTAAAHIPSGTVSCTEAIVCTVCGYALTPATGHTPVIRREAVEPTCLTAGNTADSYCEVCGEILSSYRALPALGHNIGSWTVNVPATRTTTGIMKRSCSRCDYSETHVIPMLSDHPVTGFEITTHGTQGYIGGDYQLKTSITPSDAEHKEVLWESSDTSVATINDNGYIHSMKPGVVTFTGTTLDGQYTDSITVDFRYSSNNYTVEMLQIFGCTVSINGTQITDTVKFIRLPAASEVTITITPQTQYLATGIILTANASNVEPNADGSYTIHNLHENIVLTALPFGFDGDFDDDQQYDNPAQPNKTIFDKIMDFFRRIADWFKGLFG